MAKRFRCACIHRIRSGRRRRRYCSIPACPSNLSRNSWTTSTSLPRRFMISGGGVSGIRHRIRCRFETRVTATWFTKSTQKLSRQSDLVISGSLSRKRISERHAPVWERALTRRFLISIAKAIRAAILNCSSGSLLAASLVCDRFATVFERAADSQLVVMSQKPAFALTRRKQQNGTPSNELNTQGRDKSDDYETSGITTGGITTSDNSDEYRR